MCVLLSGYVTASQWSSAIESVLKLDVPWNMLRHQLAHVLPDGRIDYCSCLDQYVIETGLHKVQTSTLHNRNMGSISCYFCIAAKMSNWAHRAGAYHGFCNMALPDEL